MLGLDTLDVAIGLVFTYLLVSFVCSAAVELVELIVKNRPKKLYDGIVQLVGSGMVEAIYNHPLVNALYQDAYKGRGRRLPSYIPARNFALALLGLIDNKNGASSNLLDLKNRIAALAAQPNMKPLYDALSAIAVNAEGKAEEVIKGIEDWFNSSMDRVSGWYKRYTHRWLLLFGVVIAVALNVDSTFIVKQLSINKTKRDAIVASAGEAIKAGLPQPTPPDTIKAAQDALAQTVERVRASGVPIGWTDEDKKDLGAAAAKHALGWLITAVAVSFGAPFWFDMLNKFMVVRSTVKPKEKSQPEPSKDK